MIQPHFDYCCEVWDEIGKGRSDRLQKLENRTARLIMNLKNEHGQSTVVWLVTLLAGYRLMNVGSR